MGMEVTPRLLYCLTARVKRAVRISPEQRRTELAKDRSTLDHLAFEIDLDAYETEKKRLEGLGLPVENTVFEWTGWRSLYISDPEGNTVEFDD